MSFDSIESAVAAFGRGELVVVVDDEDRENEGDLILAAEHASVESVAFMIRHTSGLLCVALEGERLDALDLPLMVPRNSESMGTAFTVSVDARAGTTTGISAADRTRTIRALADPSTRAADLARPGHVFPLRAHPGGVRVRRGHTEAGVALAHLSGAFPAAVLAEVINPDGSMARRPDLEQFATAHALRIITIADLVSYLRSRASGGDQLTAASRPTPCLERLAAAHLPTSYGPFSVFAFSASPGDAIQHLALVRGEVADGSPALVRVHSECLSGDVFGSRLCDCGPRLHAALQTISDAERGVVVYLRGQASRACGSNARLGVTDDAREYAAAAAVVRCLGIGQVRLLTDNPRTCIALGAHGIEVVERVPLASLPTTDSIRFVRARRARLGHLLELT